MLGAACLGDIGELFPPNDPQWKNADSRMLLKTVWERMLTAGWQLENADCVIAIQKPKILPYREAIRRSIAEILSVEIDQIFVKAKTGYRQRYGRRRVVHLSSFAVNTLSHHHV